jgi:hypothetical protein
MKSVEFYDDLCYLRQAHLFQKSGLRGLDTNILLEDDHFLSSKLKQIDFPTWNDPTTAPCHTLIPATRKLVIQYPPGTGFVLALFPEGAQVIPLYVLTSLVAFGFALAAALYASSLLSLALVAAFGDAALYLMINPTKASYSMAPTMMICAAAGFLTAKLFASEGRKRRLVLTVLVGLLLGLAVNFRLANLFLSAGYFAFFLVSFVTSRKIETALPGLLFGMAFLIGIAPTLVANAINAGSLFATTYGGADVAAAWTAMMLRWSDQNGIRQLALVVTANLVVNLIFFMTHPVFTPYYTIPIGMLSLWTLLFATLIPHREGIRDDIDLRKPIKA